MAVLFVTRNDRKALIDHFDSWLSQQNFRFPIHVTHESQHSTMNWCSNDGRVIFHEIPKLNAHCFPDWISQTIRENDISCIVPLGDRDLLPFLAQMPSLQNLGVRIASEEKFPVVARYLDKASYSELSGLNWSVPTFQIASDHSFGCSEEILGPTPWIMKPRNGTSSKGLQIIRNELHYKKADKKPDFIVQRLVEGVPITVDVLRVGSRVQFAARYRKLIVGSQSIVMTPCSDKEVLEILSEIISKIELAGVWNFQVIWDGSHCYLHDINPRASSGIYFSLARGLNLFEYIAELTTGTKSDTVVFDRPIQNDLEMCIYQDYELRGIAEL